MSNLPHFISILGFGIFTNVLQSIVIDGFRVRPKVFIRKSALKNFIIHLKDRNSIIIDGSFIGFVILLKKSNIHCIIHETILIGVLTMPNISLSIGCALLIALNNLSFISFSFILRNSLSGSFCNAFSNLSLANCKSSGRLSVDLSFGFLLSGVISLLVEPGFTNSSISFSNSSVSKFI